MSVPFPEAITEQHFDQAVDRFCALTTPHCDVSSLPIPAARAQPGTYIFRPDKGPYVKFKLLTSGLAPVDPSLFFTRCDVVSE